MKLVRLTAASLAACLAAMMVAGVAAAEPADSSQGARIVIRTHDLDLATRIGQRQLDRRIRAAAAAVCPYDNVPQHFGHAGACRREAVRGAMPQRDRVIGKAVGACSAARVSYTEPNGSGGKEQARGSIEEARGRSLG